MAIAYFRSKRAAKSLRLPRIRRNLRLDSVGLHRQVSAHAGRPAPWLVRGDINDFELGVLLIPACADVLEEMCIRDRPYVAVAS